MIEIALGIVLAVFILFNLDWILPFIGKLIGIAIFIACAVVVIGLTAIIFGG